MHLWLSRRGRGGGQSDEGVVLCCRPPKGILSLGMHACLMGGRGERGRMRAVGIWVTREASGGRGEEARTGKLSRDSNGAQGRVKCRF